MTHVDVSSFALKTNLANSKTEVDKIDIAKLTVPNDLAKLGNVVKNDVVKKIEYNKLVTKVDNVDTTGFVLKITHGADKSDLEKKISDAEKKIPNTSDLAKKQIYKLILVHFDYNSSSAPVRTGLRPVKAHVTLVRFNYNSTSS